MKKKFNKNFLNNYFSEYIKLTNPDKGLYDKFKKVFNILSNIKKSKVLIFGNGGSAAISSHFSVDLTKNAKIKCVSFNDSSLITCFSNDFGCSRWVEECLKFYAEPNDILILISSSGSSQNMINASKFAKKRGIKNIITFTEFSKNNPLKENGSINFWVNSKAYNLIENIHQLWLLTIADMMIGKKEYPAK